VEFHGSRPNAPRKIAEKAKQINNQLALNRRAIGARLALNMIAGAGPAPIAARMGRDAMATRHCSKSKSR
jgi:hypothetical protein